MKRYTLRQGKLREDPDGQWVRADEAEELERRLATFRARLLAGEWCRGLVHAPGVCKCFAVVEALGAALAAAEEKR